MALFGLLLCWLPSGKSSHGPALSYTLNQHGSCTPQPCALASFFIFGHRGHVKPLAHIGDSPEMDVSMCTPQPLCAGIVTASQLEEDLSLRELKTALCICASCQTKPLILPAHTQHPVISAQEAGR